jgi:integrase
MRIYKRKNSSFYYYEFVFNGTVYHKSTRVKNERAALTIANAFYTALAKGEVGLVAPKIAPTPRDFRKDFITAVKAEKPDKPKTVQFYTYCFDSLLKYKPIAEARLSEVDERLVQRFTVWALATKCERDEERSVGVATVNRWRSTLKKALRMARRWKLIQTVPQIPMLKGERERTFVFTEAIKKKYDELAPEPLNSFIQFSCEVGICEGELINLRKSDVHITGRADEWRHFGYVKIRSGKTEYRKRSLPVTVRVKQILTEWMARSKSELVFTREDDVSPISRYTLVQQQERMRDLLNLPWDACVHSARHTALTNLGLTGVDPFTLQQIAGHANISTTRKYVHPTPQVMKVAFKKKAEGEQKDRRKATRKQRGNVVEMESVASRSEVAVLGDPVQKTWGILGDSRV